MLDQDAAFTCECFRSSHTGFLSHTDFLKHTILRKGAKKDGITFGVKKLLIFNCPAPMPTLEADHVLVTTMFRLA